MNRHYTIIVQFNNIKSEGGKRKIELDRFNLLNTVNSITNCVDKWFNTTQQPLHEINILIISSPTSLILFLLVQSNPLSKKNKK